MAIEHASTTSLELEENQGLLRDEIDVDKADAYSVAGRWRLSLKPLSRLVVILCACAAVVVVFAVFLLKDGTAVPANSFLPDDGASDLKSRGQIAIPLHPARHATRSPTTLEFRWNVTSETQSPDGVQKNIYLVNGQFPGPTIEARSGDRVIVHAYNGLKDEGLAFHWHGLEMRGNNAMDGAVGYTQCPIPSGHEFTYNFTIGDHEHGTFWWHSHALTQRADGLYGGLIVHEPRESVHKDEREGLLMLGDWFHSNQSQILEKYRSKGNMGSEPTPSSMIINGYGRYNCSMVNKYMPVVCEQGQISDMLPLFKNKSNTRLRLINTGTLAGVSAMVEGATLQAVTVDSGCQIKAQPKASVGVLYPGQRVDALLNWSPSTSTLPRLNVYLDPENFSRHISYLNPNQSFPALPETLSAKEEELMATAFQSDGETHLDLASITASAAPSFQNFTEDAQMLHFTARTTLDVFSGGANVGALNGISWSPQLPPLLSLTRSSWQKNQNVLFVPTSGTGAKPKRLNILINNRDDGAHSFHLHGNSFYVVASYRAPGRREYPGMYEPGRPERGELGRPGEPGGWVNFDNPVRRDTVTVGRWGHVMISLVADNPGLWMMHCHMLVHQGVGMAVGFQISDGDDFDHIKAQNPSAADLCNIR